MVSIVPSNTFRTNEPPSNLILFAANSTRINTFGTKIINLDLNLRRNFSWSFIIADIPAAIIGADFLSHFGLLIDLQNQRLIDTITKLTTKGELLQTSLHNISTIDSSSPYANLLQEFIEITTPQRKPNPKRSSYAHKIVTNGQPVTAKARKLAGDKATAAKAEIHNSLEIGDLRPSSSNWASPIHLTPKKDNSWRMCGDYRKLNSITQPDKYPPPHIRNLFPLLHGKNIFSTIDLNKAYHQIPMHEDDIPKTAIITPWGLFEYVVMPCELKNATQTFQRFMDSVFRDLDFVFVYIDDILVMSNDQEQHEQHLRQVFQKLKDYSLSINPSKCHFGQPQVNFLGYTLNAQGYSPTAERLDKIHQFPRPETVMELQRFLGMINYYRRCIPEAAKLQKPLYEYLKVTKKKDKTKISWTKESIEAFDACQRCLTSTTRLAFPSPTAKLALSTDASSTGIGATLDQLEDGIWKPLGHYSRKLSSSERNYSTYDRELLAVFAGIKHFQDLLDGRHFIIKTDHKPLIYAFQQNLDKASERQRRQLDYISQFTTDIVYVKGNENIVADALSRINTIDMPTKLSLKTIQEAQEDDEELKDLIENPSSLKLQQLDIEGAKIYCDITNNIVRPYIPKTLRKIAFDVIHNVAHPSKRSTSRTLREKYVWPSIRKDALLWCRQCLSCQKAKIQRHNRLRPNHIDVPDERFSHIHMDIIFLPEIDGYQYCLTIIDRFSRWPVAVPLRNITSDTITTALFDHWISHYGTPLTITTDQGAQFESTLFQALARFIGAKKTRTTPYHPQSNGMVERWHRTLKTALMCSPEPWIKILPIILLGLRMSYKENLKATPAEMLYGTTLRLPGEFFVTSDVNPDPEIFLQKHREYMRALRPTPTAHHSRSRMFILKGLDTCSHVFVRSDHVKAPLEPPYSGPFKVEERTSDRVFKVNINGEIKSISIDRLKPAFVTKTDDLSTDETVPVQPMQPHHWKASLDRPVKTYQRKDTFKPPSGPLPGGSGCGRIGQAATPLSTRQLNYAQVAAAPRAAKPSTRRQANLQSVNLQPSSVTLQL